MNNIAQISYRQANKAFILSDFKDNGFSRFKSNPNEYAKSLSKKMRAVFMYLFQFRYKDGIVLSNTVVAHMVGCTTRTVARATRRFHDDGVLLKYHRDTYCLNNYYFHPVLIEGQGSFSLWFKNISPTQKESYWEQGIAGLTTKLNDPVIPNLKEDNKEKMISDSWDNVPQNVKNQVAMASAYGLSGDKNSLNRNDDSWYDHNRPYNDLSFENKRREPRSNANKFCFFCEDDTICCALKGGHDKKIAEQYVH